MPLALPLVKDSPAFFQPTLGVDLPKSKTLAHLCKPSLFVHYDVVDGLYGLLQVDAASTTHLCAHKIATCAKHLTFLTVCTLPVHSRCVPVCACTLWQMRSAGQLGVGAADPTTSTAPRPEAALFYACDRVDVLLRAFRLREATVVSTSFSPDFGMFEFAAIMCAQDDNG